MNKLHFIIHYHLYKPYPNTDTKPNLQLLKHNITYYMHIIQNCKNNTYVNGVCTLILTSYTSSSGSFFIRVYVYTSCNHVIPSLTIVSRELQSVQISLTTLTTVKSLTIVTTLTTQTIIYNYKI